MYGKGRNFFSFFLSPDCIKEAYPAFTQRVLGDLMSDHLAAPSADVRNVWKYRYTLTYIFMRWGIMKCIGSFTFTSVVLSVALIFPDCFI